MELSDLWLHSRNEKHARDFVQYLTPATKQWIMQHIVPTSTSNNLEPWLLSQKASILVVYGSHKLSPHSLLLQGVAGLCSAKYMFFKRCFPLRELLDREVMDAFTFLGYAGVLIVLNEFQADGGYMASIIKEMQDMGDPSTHDFGMVLYGSDAVAFKHVTRKVFYSIRSLNVITETIPDSWANESKQSAT